MSLRSRRRVSAIVGRRRQGLALDVGSANLDASTELLRRDPPVYRAVATSSAHLRM